ncbi:MAG: AAA family ATPase [Pirellulales bacterium]
MRELGFHLARLALTGPDVEDAELRFGVGLNVISGPSDTGKTFILQCIDFLLGARGTPEEIPEASNYETAILDIVALADNATYTLSRSLRGGAFQLRRQDGSETVLAERHEAEREDTVSHFLLDMIGLAGKRIRRNARGETLSLSFRNLAHLVIISEEDIIRARSPLLSGQYTTRTAEKSVFRLLLSGIDDSSVVASEEPRVSRARVDAKEEVLQELAQRARNQLAELAIGTDTSELREQHARIEAAYEDTESRLSELGASVSEVEVRRRSSWTRLRKIESRLEVLRGLSERFTLLRVQYTSDLQRLNAITEACARLSDLGVERCPVCGALPEHHDEEHRADQVDTARVANASASEAHRIRSLMSDLDATRREVSEERSTLGAERSTLQGEFADLGSTLAASLRPQAAELTEMLRTMRRERDRVSRALDLIQQLAEVEAIAEGLDVESTGSRPPSSPEISARDLEAFAQEVEQRLRAWNLPSLDRVTFSEEGWDIVISGQRRTSHGKGVRAVTHAAFSTALLAYCDERSLPHPGFVVLDSPLVVYREPDADDPELASDVKNSFFRDLATTFANCQAIVLENEQPPDDLVQSGALVLIQFTKTNTGRYGFIPNGERE